MGDEVRYEVGFVINGCFCAVTDDSFYVLEDARNYITEFRNYAGSDFPNELRLVVRKVTKEILGGMGDW